MQYIIIYGEAIIVEQSSLLMTRHFYGGLPGDVVNGDTMQLLM